MAFDDLVRRLTIDDLRTIETHYYRALDASRGSGDHFVLIGLLSQFRFRVLSREEAMNTCEKIIVRWYELNK